MASAVPGDGGESPDLVRAYRNVLDLVELVAPTLAEEARSTVAEIVVVGDSGYPAIQSLEAAHKERLGLTGFISPHNLFRIFYSATDSHSFGRVYFGASLIRDPLLSAVKLAHELGHHAFHALLCCDRVFTAPASTIVHSPARKTGRPIADALHAIVAIERELSMARRMLDHPSVVGGQDRRRIERIAFDNAAELQKSLKSVPLDKLTTAGHKLISDIQNVVAS